MLHVVLFLLKNVYMTGLKKNNDFVRVYQSGRSKADRYLVLYTLDQNPEETSRFGITVSRKIGNSVVRHRVKRRIREICRLNEYRFPAGRDYVIVARKPASAASYRELCESLDGLVKALMPD